MKLRRGLERRPRGEEARRRQAGREDDHPPSGPVADVPAGITQHQSEDRAGERHGRGRVAPLRHVVPRADAEPREEPRRDAEPGRAQRHVLEQVRGTALHVEGRPELQDQQEDPERDERQDAERSSRCSLPPQHGPRAQLPVPPDPGPDPQRDRDDEDPGLVLGIQECEPHREQRGQLCCPPGRRSFVCAGISLGERELPTRALFEVSSAGRAVPSGGWPPRSAAETRWAE
jgi:hypothetical protein